MARRGSTRCLPVGQDEGHDLVTDPACFRAWLGRSSRAGPELFPGAFGRGYRLKDARTSERAGVRLRRIRPKAAGESDSVRPSFRVPEAAGATDEVRGPPFLRAAGVPFWAPARVLGRDDMYRYRLEVSAGRNRVAGTTVRRTDLPEPLLADEHHQTRDGVESYLATAVGPGGGLGAARAQTANADDATAAYPASEQEARDVKDDDRPSTVGAGGWASTHRARQGVCPRAVLLRRFLHGGPDIRRRGKPGDAFPAPSGTVWEAHHPPDRRSFAQRLRRPSEWAGEPSLSAWLLDQVQELCGRSGGYGVAYQPPRRAPDRHYARPGDATHEPVLRGGAAAARQPGGSWAPRTGRGLAAELPPLGPGSGSRQRGPEVPGGAAQPAPLPRRLAPESPGLRLPGRLPTLLHPAPNSGAISVF